MTTDETNRLVVQQEGENVRLDDGTQGVMQGEAKVKEAKQLKKTLIN